MNSNAGQNIELVKERLKSKKNVKYVNIQRLLFEEFHYDLNNATFINEDLFEEAINLEQAGIYPRALQGRIQ